MCGIAGIVDLSGGRRAVPQAASAPWPRPSSTAAPTRTASWSGRASAFASRRLSIVGLADGRQPIHNEDGSDHRRLQRRAVRLSRDEGRAGGGGHRFRTHCDTEIIPHRWEDHGDDMFEHLRGQFAVALYDANRRRVLLGRDRFGICPLYWTRQTRRRATGCCSPPRSRRCSPPAWSPAQADLRGINHLFTFFACRGR